MEEEVAALGESLVVVGKFGLALYVGGFVDSVLDCFLVDDEDFALPDFDAMVEDVFEDDLAVIEEFLAADCLVVVFVNGLASCVRGFVATDFAATAVELLEPGLVTFTAGLVAVEVNFCWVAVEETLNVVADMFALVADVDGACHFDAESVLVED